MSLLQEKLTKKQIIPQAPVPSSVIGEWVTTIASPDEILKNPNPKAGHIYQPNNWACFQNRQESCRENESHCGIEKD